MKRRTFLKGIAAFLAAPLAFFGVKKVVEKPFDTKGAVFTVHERYKYLTDNEQWFLANEPNQKIVWETKKQRELRMAKVFNDALAAGNRVGKSRVLHRAFISKIYGEP